MKVGPEPDPPAPILLKSMKQNVFIQTWVFNAVSVMCHFWSHTHPLVLFTVNFWLPTRPRSPVPA